jgi:predicted nuclease of restriction endonuclease-like (RecB) superfamily
MCKLEKWSSRQLQESIQSLLYERTAISKKPHCIVLTKNIAGKIA